MRYFYFKGKQNLYSKTSVIHPTKMFAQMYL